MVPVPPRDYNNLQASGLHGLDGNRVWLSKSLGLWKKSCYINSFRDLLNYFVYSKHFISGSIIIGNKYNFLVKPWISIIDKKFSSLRMTSRDEQGGM
jgi:hypothetical protein